MKIQALVAAVALAVAGGAFAQSSDTSKPTPGDKAAAAAADAKADTKAAAGEVKAETRHAAKKTKKVASKSKRKARHAAHHAVMSDHHMNSTRHMGAMRSGPATDLEARERQSRMEDAYSNWQRQHKS